MSKIKKVLAITVVGTLYATAALAGSGQASTVSIGVYDTYKKGTVAPMYGTVDVSGYVNPTYSYNTCWYELHNNSTNVIYQQVKAAIGADGKLAQYQNVPTADYRLDINPNGPNYDGCNATGRAQN